MSDIKAEDIRIGDVTGAEYRVIAIHGDYAWVLLGNSSQPSTETLQFLYSRTSPKPDFFEKGKRYNRAGVRQVVIDEVQERPSGRFALATQLNTTLTHTAGDLRVLDERQWESGVWTKF